jgi:hypothetical protein
MLTIIRSRTPCLPACYPKQPVFQQNTLSSSLLSKTACLPAEHPVFQLAIQNSYPKQPVFQQNTLSSSLLSKNIKIKIYGSIILPVVLFWCETWCLKLWEKHRPRKILGTKENEVAVEWRRVHDEEL